MNILRSFEILVDTKFSIRIFIYDITYNGSYQIIAMVMLYGLKLEK